jgi:hypothetical protein
MSEIFKKYKDKIIKVLTNNQDLNDSIIAKRVLAEDSDLGENHPSFGTLRKQIARNRKAILDEHDGIYNATESIDVPNSAMKHLWFKTKEISAFVKNPNYVDAQEQIIKDLDFTSFYKEVVKPVEVTKKNKQLGFFDRLVYTDTHIGMNVNPEGNSLYGGKWDAEELFERLKVIINHVVNNQKSNVLYIDDLGDYMDGWDGQTARKGHDLPQNMSNQAAFDCGISFKVQMLDELIKYYDKIHIRNICVDNHSADFGYIVNSAFKVIAELKYPNNVFVTNQRKFIGHYKVGNFIFVLTHGKDDKNLKFGFKPKLDDVHEKKINEYIDVNYLFRQGIIIEFSKGDSHQYLFDSTPSKFNYYNYPALSPSSDWVQTNFARGKSGFVFFNYTENSKETKEYLFDWKT